MLKEFKMPDWKDTIEMKSKNGKVMRESSTASSIFPASPAKPGARKGTIQGMNTSNSRTKMLKKKAKTEIARAANSRADPLSSDTSLCDNIGTKAVVKAPSAKSERKRFGNLKETKKASEIMPAPKKFAKTMSRKKPVNLERSVKPPKVAIDLNKFIGLSLLFFDKN